ncbi:aminoglycoside phosphotransferase family protein [Streptomyces sp. NBC_00162]|uniref:aminoglycoside phosphotransferase family protein n=1 Tax=Streptomyces sp. NBC_00162 TaxID=2903629 RepID=UPI00214C17CA|nr:aminoglycoside phosphotransferase family protein [Streptomyces sp. NBC_00162]UUU44327.1 aminoglycoside phosphotransferase family protein [Streptomyces sp. NBC_00162]
MTAERLANGRRTAVYRAALADSRTVVVKLYASIARRNAVTEAAAIRAVAVAVPTARILAAGRITGTDATALISEDLGRLTLGAAVRTGQVTADRALRNVGSLLGRLHRAPVAPRTPRRPFFEDVTTLRRRDAETAGSIAPALEVISETPASVPLVWCHGDVHYDNIIIAGPEATRHLIDFTDATPGPREADVAQALVMAGAVSLRGRLAVTGAYPLALDDARLTAWCVFHTARCQATSPPGEERSRWTRRLAELAHEHPRFFHTPRTVRSPR